MNRTTNTVEVLLSNNVFRIVGKKYTSLIIWNMHFEKQSKFSQFLSSINGINATILSTRLKEMGHEKLIHKKTHNSIPVKIDYYLTTKGRGLLPILEQMKSYSMQYLT